MEHFYYFSFALLAVVIPNTASVKREKKIKKRLHHNTVCAISERLLLFSESSPFL